LLERGRDVRVLTCDQPVALLDDRDPAAEPTVDLGELEPDIAAADDDQMRWQGLECQQGRVVQVRHVPHPGEIRGRGAPADIDEDLGRFNHLAMHRHPVRAGEAAMPLEHRDARRGLHPSLDAVAGVADHGIPSCPHPRQVHVDGTADGEAELGAPLGHVDRARAGHHRLGWHAAGVDAGAAEAMAFEHRGAASRLSQPGRQRRPGLTGADDNRVESVGGHGVAAHYGAAEVFQTCNISLVLPC
jgi:hypothetical protein